VCTCVQIIKVKVGNKVGRLGMVINVGRIYKIGNVGMEVWSAHCSGSSGSLWNASKNRSLWNILTKSS